MRRLVGPKLYRLFKQSMKKEDDTKYIEYLKKCKESEIRQAFASDNKWELINIVFSCFGANYDYVTEDFIKQMFTNLTKKQKEYLQSQIHQDIYYIADDIYQDNKNTIKYYSQFVNYLFKVRNYIKYCNPIDEQIIKEYDFIMNEVFYYMYVKC